MACTVSYYPKCSSCWGSSNTNFGRFVVGGEQSDWRRGRRLEKEEFVRMIQADRGASLWLDLTEGGLFGLPPMMTQ